MNKGHATELIKHYKDPEKKYVIVTKAVWDDFDIFKFKTNNHVTHQLICGNNPFDDRKMSRLKFYNYYNLHVADFAISHGTCAELFSYLKATFEAISEEHPIGLELDVVNNKVITVVLPNISPYQDQNEKNIELKEVTPRLGQSPQPGMH